MPGHFRLWRPVWIYVRTWPPSHTDIDPVPDKINLDCIIVNVKTEIMTRSVVGGQPKGHANPSCKATEAH